MTRHSLNRRGATHAIIQSDLCIFFLFKDHIVANEQAKLEKSLTSLCNRSTVIRDNERALIKIDDSHLQVFVSSLNQFLSLCGASNAAKSSISSQQRVWLKRLFDAVLSKNCISRYRLHFCCRLKSYIWSKKVSSFFFCTVSRVGGGNRKIITELSKPVFWSTALSGKWWWLKTVRCSNIEMRKGLENLTSIKSPHPLGASTGPRWKLSRFVLNYFFRPKSQHFSFLSGTCTATWRWRLPIKYQGHWHIN